MRSYLLPDVNVWLAINHKVHLHHGSAIAWFNTLDAEDTLVFCRQTQLGLFRLLSTEAALQDETFTLRQCWKLYFEWIDSGAAEFWIEPPGLEAALQHHTSNSEISPKRWNDAYLTAFSETAATPLVTFDKALASKTRSSILLR